MTDGAEDPSIESVWQMLDTRRDILAELTDVTQADIVRSLIKAELQKQAEAIEAYKKSMEAVKTKIKK